MEPSAEQQLLVLQELTVAPLSLRVSLAAGQL